MKSYKVEVSFIFDTELVVAARTKKEAASIVAKNITMSPGPLDFPHDGTLLSFEIDKHPIKEIMGVKSVNTVTQETNNHNLVLFKIFVFFLNLPINIFVVWKKWKRYFRKNF